MASREMIDVLQRLRELDEKNPNVHTDALENTEKLNPPVEEAKKKMVKDPKTGKMVPDYAIDGKGKDDLKKENVKESITITADSPEDLPVLQQIMKLAGMSPVTPDMMPDGDNVPVMKAEPGCGTPTFDNAPDGDYEARLAKLAGIESEGVDSNFARPIDPNSVFARLGNDIQSIMNDALDGNDMADEIADELGDYLRNGEAPEGSHYEKAIGIVMDAIHDGPQAQAEAAEEAISFLHSEEKNPKFADEGTTDTATSVAKELKKMGVPADASEDEIYDMIPKALKSLGQENVLRQMNTSKGYKQDIVNDVIVAFSGMDEGYANSMGNEKEEPTYKGYDPDYSDHTEDGKPKVRYVPSRYGDNPLESIENKLMKEYQEYINTKENKE